MASPTSPHPPLYSKLTSFTSLPQVLIPYLRLKLHELFLSLGGGVDESILPPSSPSSSDTSARRRLVARLERAFVFLYPWLNTAWEVASLGWNVRYLFDRTDVWDLGSRVVMGGKVRVGRLMREDLVRPI